MGLPLSSRASQVKLGEGLPKNWKPDTAVLEAQKFYASFKSSSALLAEDIRFAIQKLRTKMRSMDLDALDDKGKPIYSIDSYTRTIKQIPELIISLDEAERALATEITQKDKIRGSQEKAMLEDE